MCQPKVAATDRKTRILSWLGLTIVCPYLSIMCFISFTIMVTILLDHWMLCIKH